MQNPRDWIQGDETAKDFFSRSLAERPSLLLPPLHRLTLRVGNVVEIIGPSPSAKSEILLQAAINCILPKEWKGVHFGGLERIAVYFDLDCRFDVLRLSNVLKLRITEAYAANLRSMNWGSCKGRKRGDFMETEIVGSDELFLACMRRFLYIRCYSSFEFLSALKTVRSQIQKESEALGINSHFLMIDSIGAFQWMDRACHPLPHCDNKMKVFSLQIWAETVVQEIRSLLQMQPLLVLATKATIFGPGTSTHGALRTSGKSYSEDMINSRASTKEGAKFVYRDYMPSVWQSFVTHRIQLGLLDDNQGGCPTYTSQWVQPSLHILDKFTVKDSGIFMMS